MRILFFICHVLPILLFYICRKNIKKKKNEYNFFCSGYSWILKIIPTKVTLLNFFITWLFYFHSQGFSCLDFFVFNSILVNNVSCKRRSSNLYVKLHYTINYIICNSLIDFQLSSGKDILIKLLNITITQ